MNKRVFGYLPSGTAVEEYILKTEAAEVGILTLGGTITHFVTDGIDVVLGWRCLEDYFEDSSRQGALIGRCGNRIRGARFTLNGKEYRLAANDGNHQLHGGTIGFDRRLWSVSEVGETHLTLTLLSYDGEEGYPGNLDVSVTYRLEGAALLIDYTATTDADTVCNLTNHAYFNLNGCGNGEVKEHLVTIAADRVTAVDGELIPTGERTSVDGTPLDFRLPHTIGERLGGDFEGYDHNLWLAPTEEREICGCRLPVVATVQGEALRMTVFTNQPCLQFYTANFLVGDSPRLKDGSGKRPFAGFCMETQLEPDAPNRGDAILRVGETYRHRTVYALERK